MADVKKCDRCGKVYYPATIGIAFLGHIVKNEVVLSSHGDGYELEDLRYDLCDKCIEELDEWMRG